MKYFPGLWQKAVSALNQFLELSQISNPEPSYEGVSKFPWGKKILLK